MILVPVESMEGSAGILYAALRARLNEPETNISHHRLPTWEDHLAFVASDPYHAWYVIVDGIDPAGTAYLSKQREIGIYLFPEYRGKGLAEAAIESLMAEHPGKFLANINPNNEASRRLFERLRFIHVQDTYARRG